MVGLWTPLSKFIHLYVHIVRYMSNPQSTIFAKILSYGCLLGFKVNNELVAWWRKIRVWVSSWTHVSSRQFFVSAEVTEEMMSPTMIIMLWLSSSKLIGRDFPEDRYDIKFDEIAFWTVTSCPQAQLPIATLWWNWNEFELIWILNDNI